MVKDTNMGIAGLELAGVGVYTKVYDYKREIYGEWICGDY